MTRLIAITSPLFSRHDCPGHPESQARLRMALKGVPEGACCMDPVPAIPRQLTAVHDPLYVRRIQEFSLSCPEGRYCHLDSDTYVTRHSFEVARLAAGAAVQASFHALDGEPCFALVRPPGHHAGRGYAMGFCLINNVAVAAQAALARVDRVAIIDWDVHHGNGTQDIFYDSGHVLYCSVHQSPWFPGTGLREEIGTGAGEGLSLNAPLSPGSGIEDYRRIFSEEFIPALRSFDPSLLIVSAGQDCLYGDPLGGMDLRPNDIGELAGILLETGIPVSFVLEGGYGPSHAAAIRAIFEAFEEN
jgi:acetoin utilization deacetylase AcuC-like enzyme